MSDTSQTPGPYKPPSFMKRWTWRRIVNTISHHRHRWYHLYWLPQYKRDKRREGADWNRWLRNCEEKLAAKVEPTDRICVVHDRATRTGIVGWYCRDSSPDFECEMVDVVRVPREDNDE